MDVLLHITTLAAWQQAGQVGEYTAPSLETEGFIHCSLPEQVAGVANALYAGREDLVLLWIDPGLVIPEIRYEGSPEAYPHLYGPLNLDAVTQVTDYSLDKRDRFTTPL